MKIYYRTSDSHYKKEKPKYITDNACFFNLLSVFQDVPVSDLSVVLTADNVSDKTFDEFKDMIKDWKQFSLIRTFGGSSAAGFREVIKNALDTTTNPEEIIFFIEDDYIFRKGSYEALLDGFRLGSDIISLYTHPDKFIPASKGGNPLVGEDGAQVTKIFLGKKAYWMLTDSTTCTWATKLKTLREIEPIIRPYISGTYPRDMEYFHELRKRGYSLVQPIPTFSTHAEVAWLSPLIGTEHSHLSKLDGWGEIISK